MISPDAKNLIYLTREELGLGGYDSRINDYENTGNEITKHYRTSLLYPTETRTKKILSLVRQDHQSCIQDGIPFNPRSYSCTFISQRFEAKMQELSFLALNTFAIPSFVTAFDISFGSTTIVGHLILGHAALVGQLDKIATDTIVTVADARKGKLSMSTQTAMYTLMIKSAQAAADILKDDNSGFSLVDRVLESLKNGNPLPITDITPTYQNPQLVLAGAEFTSRLYKAIYSIASEY